MILDELGSRICIMGPSNSGKSTLAVAIGRTRGLPPIHLDQLHHRPNTDWEPRPDEEFRALHDAAILGPRWVIDGNYARCLPQRLERATGVILLDVGVQSAVDSEQCTGRPRGRAAPTRCCAPELGEPETGNACHALKSS